MMKFPQTAIRILALFAFAWALNEPVSAADYPQRAAAATRAQKAALGQLAVPLLRRAPGLGREVVAELLLKRFSDPLASIQTSGLPVIERRKDRIDFVGKGWIMHVDEDGSSVRYRNYGYLDGVNNKALPLAQRMSQDTLEKLGMTFIKSQLGDLIPVAANEQLLPFFSEFQVGGGGSTQLGQKPIAEEVFANTVVFSRVINGVPVIGSGSKIAIIFANNGQPVGFDFDWARYEQTGEKQVTLGITAINARAAKLSAVDLKSPYTKITRFECGYFDFGARRRDPFAPLQTACAMHMHKKEIVDAAVFAKDPNSGHTVAAYMQAIPLGLKPAADTKWPEARILLGMGAEQLGAPPINVHK
jgi:hypothetical protein